MIKRRNIYELSKFFFKLSIQDLRCAVASITSHTEARLSKFLRILFTMFASKLFLTSQCVQRTDDITAVI